MRKERPNSLAPGFAVLAVICIFFAGPAHGAEQETLDRLEKIIEQQQRQIENQQKSLQELQKKVEALTDRPEQTVVKSTGGKPAVVEPGNPTARIKLYGQVNKAVLFSDDGKDTNTYLVDNDNSSTRVGVLGTIAPDDGYEIGTRIEVEYQTNPSNRVSQDDKRIGGTDFEKRHLDLFLDTKNYGKLSLGWGSTASDGTSEADLSGTGVVGYSSIADMAGGQLFYDDSTASLSATAVGSVFSNMDGLGRDERIRYDSPSYRGFMGAASYISAGGGDLALRYSARIDAYQLAAAAAYADPGSTSNSVDDSLAGSVSVLHDSGFNGTFASGRRDHKTPGRDNGMFFYTKFGYRADWFSLGKTSMSADYSRSSDIAADGDDADTVGLQLVQDFRDWGTEAYLGYRFHKLDRSGADYENINAVMAGMRVKF
jgi:hypothetical protein